jgi:hypothetical protein
VQVREERSEYAKVLETLEGLLCDRRRRGSSHAGLLVLGMPLLLPESTISLPGPLPLAKFVPNSIGLRGVGEVPIIPPLAALANAISQAIGVRMTRLPMSPGVILKAMWEQKGDG